VKDIFRKEDLKESLKVFQRSEAGSMKSYLNRRPKKADF
jgi:hypothetical protein